MMLTGTTSQERNQSRTLHVYVNDHNLQERKNEVVLMKDGWLPATKRIHTWLVKFGTAVEVVGVRSHASNVRELPRCCRVGTVCGNTAPR